MKTWSVVLAGGVGSRFWPMSTPEQPKQLLPLVTDKPMLSDTLDRVSTLAPAERTLVLTNATLRDRVAMLANGVIAEIGATQEFLVSQNPIARQFIRGETEGPLTVL